MPDIDDLFSDPNGPANRAAFTYAIITFLALHNMLGIAKDPRALAERLIEYTRREFRDWLDQIEEGGSVEG